MKRYIEILLEIIKKRNLLPKLGSIILAVILWAYISSGKSGDVKFKLPVTFTGLDENLVVSKISHKVVVVEVQGSIDDLKNVSSKNIKLTVDLSNAVPGDYKPYAIQYQKIDLTDDFKIELQPEELKIFIEKKTVRNVRIIPRYSGHTEKGFMTGKISVNPEYVKITGAGSIINNIGAIYTEVIPVDKKNLTFRQDVKIEKVNEEELLYNLSKVSVTVPILNYSEITSLEIPVVVKNNKKGLKYKLNYDRIKINVIPPENKLMNEHSFSAYVDADEIEIDNDELLRKNKIEVIGFVHVIGDSTETDNGILSSTPDRVEIVVTKE